MTGKNFSFIPIEQLYVQLQSSDKDLQLPLLNKEWKSSLNSLKQNPGINRIKIIASSIHKSPGIIAGNCCNSLCRFRSNLQILVTYIVTADILKIIFFRVSGKSKKIGGLIVYERWNWLV